MPVACCTDGCAEADCIQLTSRELSVCRAICDSKGPVSFSKLRKSTELHQEVLSRIVRRLTIHGAVEKTSRGYVGDCGR